MGVLLLSFTLADAQNLSTYDSLKQELSKKNSFQERNTIYVKLLIEQYTTGVKPNEKLIKAALENLDNIENPTILEEAIIYHNIGIYFYMRRDFEESHLYLDKAINLLKSSEEKVSYAKMLYSKAQAHIKASEFDKTVEYCAKIKEVLKETSNLKLLIETLTINANALRDLGRTDEALTELKSAMQSLDQSQPSEALNSLLSSVGRIYVNTGHYDSAKYYLQLSIDEGLKTKDKRFLASSYNNMGNALHTSGELSSALEYYLKSLELKEKIGDAKSLALAHLNVGTIRISLSKYELAKIDITKALDLATVAESIHLKVFCYSKLGDISLNLNSVDSALFYHKKSLELANKIHYSKGIVEANLSLGNAYISQNRLTLSYNHFNKAMSLAQKSGLRNFVSAAHIGIADVYIKNAKLPKEDRKLNLDKNEVEEQLVRASSDLLEMNNMSGIVTSFDALRLFYKTNQNPAKEAFYAGKYIEYKDSLYSNQNAEAIAQWETKYETAEKEKEIKLLEKDAIIAEAKAKRRQLLTISFGILAIILGAIGIILYNQLKLRQKLKMERFRNKIAADLHDDVGSTLSSISMYSEVILQKTKDSVPEIQPMLKNMSSNSREIVEAMGDIVWTINPKNNTLNSLIARVRSKTADLCDAKGVKFSFSKGNNNEINIDMESAQNIYLVLKESINNALKYSECTTLVLTTALDGKNFVFEVKDNGKGFDVSSATSGNGMRTMRERMKEIGGQLTVVSSNEGTIVSGSLKV